MRLPVVRVNGSFLVAYVCRDRTQSLCTRQQLGYSVVLVKELEVILGLLRSPAHLVIVLLNTIIIKQASCSPREQITMC